MEKRNKLRKTEDPYQLLALHILLQALIDIQLYFRKDSLPTDIIWGKRALKWFISNDPMFFVVSKYVELQPFNKPQDIFFEECIEKIEHIIINPKKRILLHYSQVNLIK